VAGAVAEVDMSVQRCVDTLLVASSTFVWSKVVTHFAVVGMLAPVGGEQ
jgi:hypothetical protein